MSLTRVECGPSTEFTCSQNISVLGDELNPNQDRMLSGSSPQIQTAETWSKLLKMKRPRLHAFQFFFLQLAPALFRSGQLLRQTRHFIVKSQGIILIASVHQLFADLPFLII